VKKNGPIEASDLKSFIHHTVSKYNNNSKQLQTDEKLNT